jgi:hypothetical protein
MGVKAYTSRAVFVSGHPGVFGIEGILFTLQDI